MERKRYLSLAYRFMRARGLREIKLTDVSAGRQALTEAEKARYREVAERFKRAHGVTKVDLEDAVRWSMLRGDRQMTPEDVKRTTPRS